MNDNKCPKCGRKLNCLGGESAHPDNWYCASCGWEAWDRTTWNEPVTRPSIATPAEANSEAATCNRCGVDIKQQRFCEICEREDAINRFLDGTFEVSTDDYADYPENMPEEWYKKPFARIRWQEDSGESSVGIPSCLGFILDVDQSGTILEELMNTCTSAEPAACSSCSGHQCAALVSGDMEACPCPCHKKEREEDKHRLALANFALSLSYKKLIERLRELLNSIEKIPASKEQTAASLECSDLYHDIRKLRESLPVGCVEPDDSEAVRLLKEVSDEQQEIEFEDCRHHAVPGELMDRLNTFLANREGEK